MFVKMNVAPAADHDEIGKVRNFADKSYLPSMRAAFCDFLKVYKS